MCALPTFRYSLQCHHDRYARELYTSDPRMAQQYCHGEFTTDDYYGPSYSMLVLLLRYVALQIVLRRKIIFTWYKVITVRYINIKCAGIGYDLLVILSLSTWKTVFVLFVKNSHVQTSRLTSVLCCRSN